MKRRLFPFTQDQILQEDMMLSAPDVTSHATKTYTAIYVMFSLDSKLAQAKMREQAEQSFVLNWEDEDILIPWPTSLTAKQAIIAWAEKVRHGE